jgi:flagellar secretion chaperone FliS
MDPRSAASAYKLETVENAPPIKIVRLLYQAALRYIDHAARCDAKDPRSMFVDWLGKADAVVTELRLALQQDTAPQIAADLEQLYLFVEDALQRAMTERDAGPLAGARNVLATLLEAWTQVELDAGPAANARGAA